MKVVYDGLIEGMGELLGEVLGVEEDEAAVKLMSQEVIANVDAIASGTGRRESQVDLVDRPGSRWDFSGHPGCRLQTLLRRQPVPGCLPHVGVIDVLQEPCLLLVVSACIPDQTQLPF